MSNKPCSSFALIIIAVLALCSCSEKSPEKPIAIDKTVPVETVLQPKDIQISNWGPKSTAVNQRFNEQPNGDSAIWFEQKGIMSSTAVEAWLGDVKLAQLIIKPNEMGTISVGSDLLKKAGSYPFYLKIVPSGARVDVGAFEITDPAAPATAAPATAAPVPVK